MTGKRWSEMATGGRAGASHFGNAGFGAIKRMEVEREERSAYKPDYIANKLLAATQ